MTITLFTAKPVTAKNLKHDIHSIFTAETLRDASCLSVVSFNSTIPRVQSFIIGYFRFGFSNVCN